MPRGGFRPGSGRPLGSREPHSLAKDQAREFVRQLITRNLEPLIQTQLHNAMGLSHLMMRDPKTGKFERVTGDAKQIDRAVKSKNACWIYTKDPNVQAFTDLMNRAIDKPSEHISIAGHDGGPLVIQWQTESLDSDSSVDEENVIDITPKQDQLSSTVQLQTLQSSPKPKSKPNFRKSRR